MITALQGTTKRLPIKATGGRVPMLTAKAAIPGDQVTLRPLIRVAPLPAANLVQFSPAAQRPQAAPAELLGSVDYYRWRAADFTRRNPGHALPAYYMGYGDKYAQRFSVELEPRLSRDGQHWLAETRLYLQTAIEAKIQADPAAFAKMELNDRAFTRFAYRTHPQAYLKAGISDLHAKDLLAIVGTPDLRDLINLKGLAQMAVVAEEMVQHKSAWVAKQFGQELAVIGRVIAPGSARSGSRGIAGALRGAARLHLG